jgi:hypothetical protein
VVADTRQRAGASDHNCSVGAGTPPRDERQQTEDDEVDGHEADRLGSSPWRRSRAHVRHILAKLDLRDRAQAIVLAHECGLVGESTTR